MLSSIVIPPEMLVEFLNQLTVVAGPPVEVQVRVNTGVSVVMSHSRLKVISSLIFKSPTVSRIARILRNNTLRGACEYAT